MLSSAQIKVEIDSIWYFLWEDNKSAMVTSGDWGLIKPQDKLGYVGDIIIPSNVEYNGEIYSVESIGRSAFSCCGGMTSITIPNTLKRTEYYAFGGCDNLNSVHISDLEAWCKIDFGTWSGNPLEFAEHLYLNGKELIDIIIPEGVTSIGYHAFYKYIGLRSIIIPKSVTSIGESAFYGCI